MRVHLAALVAMVFAVAGLGASSALAAPADQTIADVDALAPIATQSGWLAWSESDGAGGFRLVLRAPDGTTRRPAIRPRSVPFDVDLGPGAHGGVVAAYSRCATEPVPVRGYPIPTPYARGRGCAPYLLDVTGDRERRVTQADAPGASEVWPSPWRGRLAFVRVPDRGRRTPAIYVGRSEGAARSVRQVGGSPSVCGTGAVGCDPRNDLAALQLELHGDRLAFAWEHAVGSGGPDTEIRLDAVGGRGRLLIAQHGGGLTQVQLGWPSFSGRWLIWSRLCFGDPGGCPRRHGLERAPLAGGAVQRAPDPRVTISLDADASATYILDQGEGDGCVASSTPTPCALRRITPAWPAA